MERAIGNNMHQTKKASEGRVQDQVTKAETGVGVRGYSQCQVPESH